MTPLRKKYNASKIKLEKMKLAHSELWRQLKIEDIEATAKRKEDALSEAQKRRRESKRINDERILKIKQDEKSNYNKHKHILDSPRVINDNFAKYLLIQMFGEEYKTRDIVTNKLNDSLRKYLGYRDLTVLILLSDGNSLTDIGYALCITSTRVRQIRDKSLKIIKHKMLVDNFVEVAPNR